MRWLMLLLLLLWPVQASGQTTTASVAAYSPYACAAYREAAILNAAAADKAEIKLTLERASHQATRTELVKARQLATTPPDAVKPGRDVFVAIAVFAVVVGAGIGGYMLGKGSARAIVIEGVP